MQPPAITIPAHLHNPSHTDTVCFPMLYHHHHHPDPLSGIPRDSPPAQPPSPAVFLPPSPRASSMLLAVSTRYASCMPPLATPFLNPSHSPCCPLPPPALGPLPPQGIFNAARRFYMLFQLHTTAELYKFHGMFGKNSYNQVGRGGRQGGRGAGSTLGWKEVRSTVPMSPLNHPPADS